MSEQKFGKVEVISTTATVTDKIDGMDVPQEVNSTSEYEAQEVSEVNVAEEKVVEVAKEEAVKEPVEKKLSTPVVEVKREHKTLADLVNKVESEEETVEQATPSENEVTEATDFLKDLLTKVANGEFDETCKKIAREKGVSHKKLAQTAFQKILGTIGDVLGLAVGTVKNLCSATVSLIAYVLKGSINVICSVANKLTSILTLNYTRKATV